MYRTEYGVFDISRRIDGLYNVWAYMMWPDDELDESPEKRAEFLRRTQGWCARGWVVVHVARSQQAAKDFIFNRRSR